MIGDKYRFLVTGTETDGKYACWEAIVPPGGGPPMHRHSREDESFFILEGEVSFFVGDQRTVAKPGTFVHLANGSVHGFRNEGSVPAKMLIHVVPAGIEQMFFDVGNPIDRDGVAPNPTSEEIARLITVAAEKYGIEIFPPAG